MFLKYNSKYASADITYYSSSSARDVENPISSISHYCEDVISRTGSHEPILEISERENLSRCVTSLSLTSFLKTERRLIYGAIVSCLRSFCSIFVQRNYRKRLPTVEQTGKQDYFKFISNNFANTCESCSCLPII